MNLTFFAGLRVASSILSLEEPIEQKQTAGGSIIRASLGEALWAGQATLVPAYHAEARANSAVLSELVRPGQSLLVADKSYLGPRNDPTGAILGSANPVIHSLGVGGRTLRVSGLPSGYKLEVGDRLAFTYGANPVRYALHEIVAGGGPASGGVSPWLTINPNIRTGAVTGAAVSLIRPGCKAVLSAISRGTSAGIVTSGVSFSFVQTLR